MNHTAAVKTISYSICDYDLPDLDTDECITFREKALEVLSHQYPNAKIQISDSDKSTTCFISGCGDEKRDLEDDFFEFCHEMESRILNT
jgi:hypothetical protein